MRQPLSRDEEESDAVISEDKKKFKKVVKKSPKGINKIKFKKIDLQNRVVNASIKAKDISRNLSEKYRVTQSSADTSTGPNSVGLRMASLKQRVKLMPGSGKKSAKISATSSNSQKSS